mmetsp:Transcript_26625/g.51269  ORF Transcript_26625/g.51269 Transcript_26625/m.51269 type:complete len:388 (+) Transcript_26625:83-1246(+)
MSRAWWLNSPAGSRLDDSVVIADAAAMSASPHPLARGRHQVRTSQRRRLAATFVAMLSTVAAQLAVIATSGNGMGTAFGKMKLRGGQKAQVTTFPMPSQRQPRQPKVLSEEELERLAVEEELEECAARGRWERSLALLEDLHSRRLKRTIRAWNFAANACAMEGQWRQAFSLLSTMENATVKPDHMTFRSVLEACDLDFVNSHHQVDGLMMDIKRHGFLPVLDHYEKAISVMAKAKQLDQATAYYEEASKFGLFNVWSEKGRSLDVRELPTQVAEVVLRSELEKRAVWNAGGKAGRGGFNVLTGGSAKSTALKQKALVRIMEEEYGLKVRLEPAKFGRCLVKNDELVRAGREVAEQTGDAKGVRSGRGNWQRTRTANKRRREVYEKQ